MCRWGGDTSVCSDLRCHFFDPPSSPSPFSVTQQAEMEERRQFMLDQILLPEAKERLARIGRWARVVYLSDKLSYFLRRSFESNLDKMLFGLVAFNLPPPPSVPFQKKASTMSQHSAPPLYLFLHPTTHPTQQSSGKKKRAPSKTCCCKPPPRAD